MFRLDDILKNIKDLPQLGPSGYDVPPVREVKVLRYGKAAAATTTEVVHTMRGHFAEMI